MVRNYEEFQKLSRDNIDATLQSFGAVSKSVQAIVVEMTDFSKKAFEQNTAAVEKLLGVRSFDKAVEVQTELVKGAYENYVSEANKLGEMFNDLAKESYKPFEAYLAKASAPR